MKIALDARFRTRSGPSTYIFNLLPQLYEQAGDDFEFVVIHYENQSLDPIVRTWPVILAPMRSLLADLTWTNFRLPGLMQEHGVDLYHGLKLFGPWWSTTPMVHTAGSPSRSRPGQLKLTAQQKLTWGVYGSHCYQSSRKVIVASEYVANALEQDLGIPRDRLEVIYFGVDQAIRDRIEQTKPDPTLLPNGQPFVLCVGNVLEVKNHPAAIRAFASIADRVPHDLVIAGGDKFPYSDEVRKVADELGVTDRVHFTGFLAKEELIRYLRSATVVMHPSFSEGLPLAIGEALACGVPVIATDLGWAREAIGPAGRFVADPKDHEAFARELLGLLEDQETHQALSAAAVDYAASFNWPNTARRTLDVYRQCLNGDSK